MDSKEVRDYWDACYDILLKQRAKYIQDFNNLYIELEKVQKEITSINTALDKMLEIGAELKLVN